MNDTPQNNSDEFWKQIDNGSTPQQAQEPSVHIPQQAVPAQPVPPQIPEQPVAPQPTYAPQPQQQYGQAQAPYTPQAQQQYGQQAYSVPAPSIGTYYQNNAQRYSDPNKLAGPLLSLAIYQIVLLCFYGIGLIGVLINIVDYNNYTEDYLLSNYVPSTGWLILNGLIALALTVALLIGCIQIFRKKKMGIVFTYISIGLTIINQIYGVFVVWLVYSKLEDAFGSFTPDFPIGKVIFILFFGAILWAVEVVLLLVPASRRNIREVFN